LKFRHAQLGYAKLERNVEMNLSAPTKIVFIIAVILAVLSLLPVLGIAVAILGAYSYWLLLVAFIVLAVGCLLRGV
jgi:hypothetical protein